MNKSEVTAALETTKKFVAHNASDTTEENTEEIQSLLSACNEAVQNDDPDEAQNILSQIASLSPEGWDLTSDIENQINQ